MRSRATTGDPLAVWRRLQATGRLAPRRSNSAGKTETPVSEPLHTPVATAPSGTPTPQELVRDWIGEAGHLSLDEVEQYKRGANCRRYVACLTVAVQSGWLQFTCSECSAYEQRPDDDRERALLARLGEAVFGGKVAGAD